MLAVLIALGCWQVQRLQWKTELLATIDRNMHQPPVELAVFSETNTDYRPVKITGRFDNAHIFYLLAISKDGAGGYHVLTPFIVGDDHTLLVDRGWIPYSRRQNEDFAKITGPTSLTGILRFPDHHHWLQPANNPASDEYTWIDLAALAQASGGPLLPYIVEADDAPNTGGYPVGGQTRVDFPNNHLSYALTWFGFALILLIIYLLSVFPKKSSD